MNTTLNNYLNNSPHDSRSNEPDHSFYTEQGFKNILDQLNAGIAQADITGKIINANARYCEIAGYTKEELLGRTIMDITHPDDLPQTIHFFNKCHSEGSNYFLEKRYVRKNGEVVWINNSVSLTSTSTGEQILTAVTIDITEQKQTEKTLRDSEERYQNFIRNSTEGIWRFETGVPVSVDLPVENQIELFFEHAFLAECNDAIAQMYGYTHATEIIGIKLCKFFPRDADTNAYFTAFIQSGYRLEEVESKELDRQGQVKFFSNTLLGVVESGMLVRCWGTQRDVTAQRQMEEKLKESEERFQAMSDTLPQMVWVSDQSGTNEYFSRQWMDYSGISDPVSAWEYMIHPDDKEPSENEFKRSRATGISSQVEIRLRNQSGEYRWHYSIIEPVKDKSGTIIKWVGAITDIHDRKLLLENLEHLVAARTKELRDSNESLQQFAHVASHDLKEPVRKFCLYSNRLQQEFSSVLPERALLYLNKMVAASERMVLMIDGVLHYASLSGLQEAFERVDLNKIISDIVSDLEVPITEKQAVIEFKPLPSLNGIPALIYQLFYNLIHNSLKFAKPGVTPVISILAEQQKVDDNGFITITVKDNGTGFQPHFAQQIFHPFVRLHPRGPVDGTGLGLSLCRNIINRHGGAIRAVGETGEGAAFIFSLPAAK